MASSLESAVTNVFMAIMDLPASERKIGSITSLFRYEDRSGTKSEAKREEAAHIIKMMKTWSLNHDTAMAIGDLYDKLIVKHPKLIDLARLAMIEAKRAASDDKLASEWRLIFSRRFPTLVVVTENRGSISVGKDIFVSPSPDTFSMTSVYRPITMLGHGLYVEEAELLLSELTKAVEIAKDIDANPLRYFGPRDVVDGLVLVGRVDGKPVYYRVLDVNGKRVTLISDDDSNASEVEGKLVDPKVVQLGDLLLVDHKDVRRFVDKGLDIKYLEEEYLHGPLPKVKSKKASVVAKKKIVVKKKAKAAPAKKTTAKKVASKKKAVAKKTKK